MENRENRLLLNNLLLHVLEQASWYAAVAHEVLREAIAAVAHSVRLDQFLVLFNWHRLHLPPRAADLRPAPLLDLPFDELLLHHSDHLLAQLFPFANVRSGQNAFRQRIYF